MDLFLIKIPNKLERFEMFAKSEKMRLERNITEADRTIMLKNLEVIEGDIINANRSQLRDYMEIMHTIDDYAKPSITSWLDQRIAKGQLNKKISKKFQTWVRGKSRGVLPITYVMEGMGLKKLADTVHSHVAAELGHLGKFTKFESRMNETLGRRYFSKIKNSL